MAQPQSTDSFDLQLVNICHEFEQKWVNKNNAQLKRYLKSVSRAHRGELFKVLVEIDLEKKRKSGIVVSADDYSEYGAGAVKYVDRLLTKNIDSSIINTTSSAGNEIANYFKSDLIGPYELVEQIGEGGMGQVWRAQQSKPVKRLVALKLIKPQIGSPETIARFDAERQALALMAHPNIAKIFDAGTAEDGSPYFVMELVEGTPLHHFMSSRNASIGERLEVFLSICDAIQHAHQKGVIHRDLKPSNILVHLQDGKPTAKIIDFGLAKALDQTNKLTEQTLLTEYGNLVGTIQYMSPEQASLDGIEPDARSDIFSLGVILYQLLVGEPPINKQTVKQKGVLRVLEMIRSEVPQRPSKKIDSIEQSRDGSSRKISSNSSKLRADLKGDLDWIVMKALEIRPERRYQTASAFADDIRNYIAGEPVNARPPSKSYKVKKLAQKNKTLLAVSLLFVASLVTVLVAIALFVNAANLANGKIASNGDNSSANSGDQNADPSETGQPVPVSNVNAVPNAEAGFYRARSNFLLANAHWEMHDVMEARRLLHSIPQKFRGLEWYLSNKEFEGSEFTLDGYRNRLVCVEISPDGKLIATGGDERKIRIWDAASGKNIRTLSGHSRTVEDLDFDPMGGRIVSGSWDQTIKIWNVQSGALEKSFNPQQKGVMCVRFSPDGKTIASGGADHSIKLFDAGSGRQLEKLSGHRIRVSDIEFSPNNETLVSIDSYGETMIWDLEIAQKSVAFGGKGATPRPRTIAMHPNGSRIVSVNESGLTIFNTITVAVEQEIKIHDALATTVAYSPDGEIIAAGCNEGTIRLWNASTGEELVTLRGHTSTVFDIDFLLGGRRLVSCSNDRSFKVWLIDKPSNQLSFPAGSNAINCHYLSKDGKILLCGGVHGSLSYCDLVKRKTTKQFKAHSDAVNCIAVTSDEKLVATGGQDAAVKIWNFETGELVKVLAEDITAVTSVCFSTDDKYVACDAGRGLIHVYEYDSGKRVSTISAAPPRKETIGRQTRSYGPGIITKLLFNHDDSMLISCTKGRKEIQVWDPVSGDRIRTLIGLRNTVNSIRLNPARPNELVAGGRGFRVGERGWIKVWDLESGVNRKTVTVADPSVTSVSFGQATDQLISASVSLGNGTGTVKIWDINDGSELKSFTYSCRGNIDAEVCLGGEGILIVEQNNSEVTIIEAPRPESRYLLAGHHYPVSKIALDPNKPLLYSEDAAGTRLVWNVESKSAVSNSEWNSQVTTSHISAVTSRWLAKPWGNEIMLVDLQALNSPTEMNRREFKSRFAPAWHRQQVNQALAAKNYYAAAFHIACLCENDTDNSLVHHSKLRDVVKTITDNRQFDTEGDQDIPPLARKMLGFTGDMLFNGQPIPVNPDGTVSVDVAYDDFQPYFDNLAAAGYRPKEFNITVDDAKGTKSISALFQRENLDSWEMRPELTESQFKQKNQEWEKKGGTLVFQQQYQENGKTYFGAIWKKQADD